MRIAFLFLTLIGVGIFILSRAPSKTQAPPTPLARIVSPQLQSTRSDSQADVLALVGEIETTALSSEMSERARVFCDLLPALVNLDSFAAAGLLEKIDAGEFRDEYIVRLAQLWAARDPESALKWASEIKSAAERFSAVRSVCMEISQVDPAAAIRAIESLNVPNDRNALENIVQLWTAADPSAATQWALAQLPGESRDALVTRVAFAVSQIDPREAANLIVKNIPAGASQTEAAISVLHRWALQDWAGAKQWVDQFPEGPLRERAQNEITGVQDYLAETRAAH
jgi:hypothetical protein